MNKHGLPARGFACLLIWLALGVTQLFAAGELAIQRLTTNGRVNPLGIAAADVSFGWSATAEARGVSQQSYQIRVGTAPGQQDIWDSGEVQSARQVDIVLPSSIPLSPATRYHWQSRIRDQNGVMTEWSEPAWFETGLLATADWAGGEWITRPIQSPDTGSWTNYSVILDFTLQNEAFGVFLRSSADGQNAYMFQVNLTGSAPAFKPHRRTNGNYSVLATVNLSAFGFTNAGLKGTRNTLRFDVAGTTITTLLNGTTVDTRSGIALPDGLVGFRTNGAEAGLVHSVRVVDTSSGLNLINPDFSQGQNGFSGGAVSNGALAVSGTTDAIFANLPPSLPLLRGEFTARTGIVSARVYASAQGLYQVSINGQKAGDQFLAPGWTSYGKRIQAQTYDVTDLVQPGVNAIGAALADGWYKGKVGLGWSRAYGSQTAFVAKIKVSYDDGTSDWFSTGAGWTASDGPCVRGDLQDGETYNAHLEQTGWDTASFDDSAWVAAGTTTNASARLVPQPDEPIRAVELLTAQSRIEILPQTWLYDLGQNMVGVGRITLTGTAGETVIIRHGEELYRTGARTGQMYTDNLRTAKATDRYTFATTGTVTYQPTFTQHGFRYIEITGIATPPATAEVKGVVLSSDLAHTGDLETSHPMLNQLVKNIRRGQRSNFLSIPTDTPARDERLGWTGDISVFSPAAARYMDTRAFLSKWMDDVRDSQKPNGNIPAVVPQPLNQFDETGVGWSDAVITVPYSVWKAHGDERIIRQNWTAMKAFYQFVHSSATGDGDLLEQGRNSWFSGDWLTLESVSRLEEHKVIGTAYFAENTRMMSEMAAVMGETANAAQWAALVPGIRAAFVNAYRSPDGSIYTGTQTAYAMALGMDMIADPAQREQTAAKYVQKLAADNNHLKTGFLGTPLLLPALSKIGRDDLSMKLLLNEDYPSWGFPISLGATTMWERWNTIQPSGEFGPVDMNSFNHYAYGAVGDWMFGNLGGIRMEEAGYRKSLVAPLIGHGGLTHAACWQDTVYGRLGVDWSVSAEGTDLTIQVPVNTTATVRLPESEGAVILEGGVPVAEVSGVEFLRVENGATFYSVGSGTYVFTWAQQVDPPALLTADAASNQVTLGWSPAPGATGYKVMRSTTGGGPYTTVASGIEENAYTDTGLVNGLTYHYVVSTTGAAGDSVRSAEVSATPAIIGNAGFETPVTSTFVYNPAGGGWTFSAQSGISANGSVFTAGSANAPEGVQAAFIQGTGSISRTFSGLTPGVSYAIVFSAAQRATGSGWNTNGQTWKVTVDGATVANHTPGQAATAYTGYSAVFTATAASHTIAFVGTNTRGGDNTVFLDHVRIVRSNPAGVANPGFETPSTATFQYNPADASWSFSPQAGSSGSGVARNASLFTTGNPNAPEGVQVAFLQSTGSVTQTVTGLVPGMRYHLLFSAAQRAVHVNGGQTWNVTLDGTSVASFKPGATATAYTGYAASFTATAASHAIAFVGTNTNGGDNTVFIDDIRLNAESPAAPGLEANAGNKRVELVWSAAAGAIGYLISRSADGGAPQSFAVDETQLAYADVNLTNGLAYVYQVSALDETGVGLASGPVTAVPVAPPVTDKEKSAPLLTWVADGGGGTRPVIGMVDSVPGRIYTLQSSPDLTESSWQPVNGLDPLEGNGGNLSFAVHAPVSEPRLFFRISIGN